MSMLRKVASGLRGLFLRERVDRELEEELRTCLELEIEARMREGMSREEAARAVRLKRGNIEVAKEIVHAAGWESVVDSWWRDLRFAARALRRSPGFATVAIVTLGLGIGASTAIFSVVEAVLLRSLPYPDPARIVRVWELRPDGHRMPFADPNFADFRAQNRTFASLAEYSTWPASVSGGSEPVRVDVTTVSDDFFSSLGVAPFRGRGFAKDERRLHGAPAVIVSYRFWQRRLGAAPDLSRSPLVIDGKVYPVVGVMPARFDFPPGVAAWIPRQFEPEPSRTAHNFQAIGRLRDGTSLAQARADVSTIAHRIKAQYGKDVELFDASVAPLADDLVGEVRAALLTLSGAVGLLLLVACANVAGLLLARTSARRKEVAVRAALGAGRGRLIQQFMAESMFLSCAGGVLGIVIAIGAVRALPTVIPTNLPRQEGIGINPAVLLFALAATLLVALGLGLFSSRRLGAEDLQQALSAGSRNYSHGGNRRLRHFLVTGEIALTLAILVGAGLLGRSFLRLVSTSPGFHQENLVTIGFSPPAAKWSDPQAIARQVHQLDEIVSRLRAIPRVESVGLTGALPVAGGDDMATGNFLLLNGAPTPADLEGFGRMARDSSRVGHADYCVVGEDYFRTLGVPLRRGREFDSRDVVETPHVAVINESLARQRWPGRDPVGQIIEFGNMDSNLQPLTIVGVVGDVRARARFSPARHRLCGLPSARSPERQVAHPPRAQRCSRRRDHFGGARHFP